MVLIHWYNLHISYLSQQYTENTECCVFPSLKCTNVSCYLFKKVFVNIDGVILHSSEEKVPSSYSL